MSEDPVLLILLNTYLFGYKLDHLWYRGGFYTRLARAAHFIHNARENGFVHRR